MATDTKKPAPAAEKPKKEKPEKPSRAKEPSTGVSLSLPDRLVERIDTMRKSAFPGMDLPFSGMASYLLTLGLEAHDAKTAKGGK